MKGRSIRFAWSIVLLTATPFPVLAAEFLVHDQAEYRAAMAKAGPGDILRLADGEWKDFPVLFEGTGTEKLPITLTAQTKGKVVLSGASSLRLAGSYLVVSGLVFRGGHAPGAEVISFRRDSRNVAVHSRLTEVVIDHFNQTDRRKEDRWVSLYGHDNRVDHSWFAGKGNAGVTLAVIRPKGQGEANRHSIDHNYFGPRPPLGSNGGETIRIGTSDESLSDSASLVENNVFDRCDGEVEIVSVKSGGNIIRGNLILRSQGSIVLRHGNGNLVERNLFMGHGKPHTGGVRVINMRQTVRDNYMEGLAGTDFTSALAVMNGVPGSAINRYHPVSQAVIAHNSILNAGRITLGAGADAERTAAPVQSELRANLMTGANADTLFQIDAATRGIAFSGNVTNAAVPAALSAGVRKGGVALTRAANGLLYPSEPKLAQVGAPRDLKPVALTEVGPDWYAKPADQTAFGTGRIVTVAADGLATAAAQAAPGDVLRLKAGNYTVNAPLHIAVPLTITGPAGAQIVFSSTTLFALADGGRLRLEGLTIRGDKAPRQPGNAAVRAAQVSTIANYAVEMDGTAFAGMDAAPGFDLIATAPATFADHIDLKGITVTGLSGKVLAASAETGGKGLYAAEHIRIVNSHFERIGALADILRGGTDESTFGPEVTITGNTVAQSGPVLLTLSGVQSTLIEGNTFRRGGAITLAHSVGSPDTRVLGNRLVETPEPLIKKLYPQGTPKIQVSDNTRSGDAS
ncbi:polysaccharide lyase 6 family protein [Novosphingobium sp. P6W]|uniref:polysaccharide lyase 6 family protein n=1 Tax=Novosphingobium sp. P6W TaxID=1609758 RepID=UPI0005C308E5|nr:polysaccharide lyase 6 family protein [Novosphingobium sp. P6W]KIS34264.1 poly(beta-D-mannuronate) lyase [Novosphingobium sp. P6W]